MNRNIFGLAVLFLGIMITLKQVIIFLHNLAILPHMFYSFIPLVDQLTFSVL